MAMTVNVVFAINYSQNHREVILNYFNQWLSIGLIVEVDHLKKSLLSRKQSRATLPVVLVTP